MVPSDDPGGVRGAERCRASDTAADVAPGPHDARPEIPRRATAVGRDGPRCAQGGESGQGDRIAAICRSFAQAAPQRRAWAEAFDHALGRLNPESRRLFGQDGERRARRFAAMLEMIVDSLRRPQRREALYAALGRRHARHGFSEDHYDDAGAALLIALRDVLGERYTEDVEAAWATLYAELVEPMIAASRCIAPCGRGPP